MLEWKTHNGDLPLGQRIMYERLSKTGDITIICVVGNAETMECSECCEYFKGKRYPEKYKAATLRDIKESIRKWVKYAATNNNN